MPELAPVGTVSSIRDFWINLPVHYDIPVLSPVMTVWGMVRKLFLVRDLVVSKIFSVAGKSGDKSVLERKCVTKAGVADRLLSPRSQSAGQQRSTSIMPFSKESIQW